MTTDRTEAGEQYVIPGAEADQDRSAKARESERAWEIEVRARQSKMRKAKPQQDAGPLFDTQDSLF